MLYKVLLYGGYIYLIEAPSLEAAKKQALSEEGSVNVQSVTLANDDDIAWWIDQQSS